MFIQLTKRQGTGNSEILVNMDKVMWVERIAHGSTLHFELWDVHQVMDVEEYPDQIKLMLEG